MVTSKIGFLTYDLQPFTEDCLFRVSQELPNAEVCAYPVIAHTEQSRSRIKYLLSSTKGRFLGLRSSHATPEGLASNINWRAAWHCVANSDICVLFGLQGGTALLVAFLARLAGRILVSVNQTLPEKWERRRRWWVRGLKWCLLRQCHIHIYQTLASREVLEQVYGVSKDKLVYAPFEAGARLFRRAISELRKSKYEVRESLGVAADTVLFLFVGNLHPFKGVLDLLQSIARVTSTSSTVIRCLFVGPEEPRNPEGATIPYFLRMAEQWGCSPYVQFLGPQNMQRLVELYSAADVVVLPTHRDMFPKVLVEGALIGKPLLTTTACGAVGSLILDGENGLVIEPGDVDGLSRAIVRLLDPRLRESMGERSKEIVSQLCDSAAETHGFVDALSRAVGELHQRSGSL